MKLRNLSSAEVAKFAARKGVKQIAVENFLSSCGGMEYSDANGNIGYDARLYKWNAATQKAIRDGISLACKPAK